MKVSLAGIDAPQISSTRKNPDQLYSRRAKTYLTELVLNQLVEIKGYGLDQNDHVLGVIFLEGKNINIEMIRAGVARAFIEKLPKDLGPGPYREVEKEARKAERGIWSQGEK